MSCANTFKLCFSNSPGQKAFSAGVEQTESMRGSLTKQGKAAGATMHTFPLSMKGWESACLRFLEGNRWTKCAVVKSA